MSDNTSYSALLNQAISQKGYISKCYSVFYEYSIGNQFLAMDQLISRKLPITPIATFKKWLELGRTVQKGQKAISLVMPVSFSKKDKNDEKTDQKISTFLLRPKWFAMSQTEGENYTPPNVIPNWDEQKALTTLAIDRVPFEHISGNCQGYAASNKVAVNPVAKYPEKTLFHEIAHVVLGHTKEALMSDSEQTPLNIKEVQAESVAYILCSILSVGNLDTCAGYIQSWLKNEAVGNKEAQQIFSAANKILKAGQSIGENQTNEND